MEQLIFDQEKLKQMLAEHLAKRDAILAQTAPIQEKRDSLWAEMEPRKAEYQRLGEEAARLEAEGELAVLSKNIVTILKILKPDAVRSLAAEPGSFGLST